MNPNKHNDHVSLEPNQLQVNVRKKANLNMEISLTYYTMFVDGKWVIAFYFPFNSETLGCRVGPIRVFWHNEACE